MDFNSKVEKSIDVVKSVLGLPSSPLTFKKFLVDPKSINLTKLEDIETSEITEYFLPSNPSMDDKRDDRLSICVRLRQKHGLKSYNYEKRFFHEG